MVCSGGGRTDEYNVPEADKKEFTCSTPIELKLTSSFQFTDQQGKLVSDLLQAYVKSNFKGDIATKPVGGVCCQCIEGKLTLELSGDAQVQTRPDPGKEWGPNTNISQPKKSIQQEFTTCKKGAAKTRLAHVAGQMTDTIEFEPNDYWIIKINKGSFAWEMKLDAETYSYK